MIVLDTNVLSELVRPIPHPAVVQWLDAQPPDDIATTAVTAAELFVGVARLPHGRRRERLSAAVRDSLSIDLADRILPFDADAAECYAAVTTVRLAVGRPVGVPDAQIAAICRSTMARLATRNTKDFDGTGIDVVNPWLA